MCELINFFIRNISILNHGFKFFVMSELYFKKSLLLIFKKEVLRFLKEI
jgi:hypothetical protein